MNKITAGFYRSAICMALATAAMSSHAELMANALSNNALSNNALSNNAITANALSNNAVAVHGLQGDAATLPASAAVGRYTPSASWPLSAVRASSAADVQR